MSITGQLLIIFVIVHMIGNSSIFLGADGINAYAKHLHDLPPLVWIFRLVMLTAVAIHIIYGIQVTLENNKANAKSYAVQNHLKATFASKNMIWTGLLIGAFVIYHLLHFTLHITNPEISAGLAGNFDALQRPDVFKMVVLSFQKGLIASCMLLPWSFFSFTSAMVSRASCRRWAGITTRLALYSPLSARLFPAFSW